LITVKSKMEETQDKGTVTLKKSTLWKISTFVFAGLFIISLFTGGFGLSRNGNDITGQVVNQPTAPSGGAAGNIKVTIDKEDPVLGDSKAPITIVEFSDFQCPFCGRAATGAIAELKNNEIKDGKVKLIYKDFPLNSIHPFAQKAAEAAECANEQGKFWEYHDTLFENQQALAITDLKKYAEDISLETEKFNGCLDSGKYTKEVNADLSAATSAGGQGTPYFVVIGKNGKTQVVSGAQPYANFQSAIATVA